MSRMDVLSDSELNSLNSESKLVKKYNQEIDRESAYEMLNEKIKKAEKLRQKTMNAEKKKKNEKLQRKEVQVLDTKE